MRRFLAVLFWSVIAAAFIGPGTVTTAASAGASHGSRLLWALLFSTAACWILQEASARLTVISGRNLGQALTLRFRGGAGAIAMLALVLAAIVLGCAAYEAGNILGGVAGAGLAVDLSPQVLTALCGLAAAALLWIGTPRGVALTLSVLVAVMGLAFVVAAFLLRPPAGELLSGLAIPSLPEGSGLLVLGLIGTTVVPYNLFLGSGLAEGQRLGEARFGIAVAVILGGFISMAVLVVGAALDGPFSFAGMSQLLGERLGSWASPLFAAGLFAAGFSSAVTAPLAAAITAGSLFAPEGGDPRWQPTGALYRSVWLGVLAVGVGFGMSGLQPVPVILVAQAANGVLLPLVAIFLLLTVNDRSLLGEEGVNGPLLNVLTALVVLVTITLGLVNVSKAATRALGWPLPGEATLFGAAAIVAAGVALFIGKRLRELRREP